MTGIIAGVGLGGGAAAQAESHRDSSRRTDSGDSTAFVHRIQWSSSSPVPGVTLLSGVYSDPRAPRGTLPAGDTAVQAIGTYAAWLSAHAQLGQQLGVSEQLRIASGAPFPLNPQMSIATADGIPESVPA